MSQQIIHPFKIKDQQEFKIKVRLKDRTVRDEFTGCGQKSFDEIYAFANKVMGIYDDSRIEVYLKSCIK